MPEQEVAFGDEELKGLLFLGQSADEPTANKQPSEKKKSGLVICHGFPSFNSPEKPCRPLAARIQEELGWPVLLFNYRGCGASKGNFSMLGWLEDVFAAVKYLEGMASEVWLAGFGMGGSLAINCASRQKDIAGVVTAGAPADLSDWEENSLHLLDYSRQLGIISEPDFPADEESWKNEFAEFQVEKHSGELAGRPLLVIHGSEDALVPTLDARAIAESHNGAEVRIMEGVTHQLPLDPRVLSIILGWLSRHRPPH